MNVSSLGIGSGIDIRELVDKLVEAEGKDKKTRFNLSEAKGIEKITAYELLAKALSAFKDKVSQLQFDSSDKESTKKAVQEFVQDYNLVFNTLRELTAVDKTGLKENGVLVGDATARNLGTQLRRVLNDTDFFLVGVSSDAITGCLVIDEKRLDKVLEDDLAKVSDIVIDATHKIQSLNSKDAIQNNIESTVGSLRKINEQRAILERRLQKTEERLMAQFIAMDKIVAKLKSTGEFLSSQLQSLPEPASVRKS